MNRSARIIVGDCRSMLATMEENSIDCCVTSPPYWGLRDYGIVEQIGLDPSVDAWVDELVAVFEGVRRVLKPSGTLWLNLGDAYANFDKWGGESGEKNYTSAEGGCSRVRKGKDCDPKRGDAATGQPMRRSTPNLKAKDLIGQPWMVAFALRAAGWYLRADIIWHKPNPMPESVTDRPTKAHEYIFLLTKSERYDYDAAAIAEAVSDNTHARVSQDVAAQIGSARAHAGERRGKMMKAVVKSPAGWATHAGDHGTIHRDGREGPGSRMHKTRTPHGSPPTRKLADPGSGIKSNSSMDAALALPVLTRNARSVWTIPTQGYKGSHFATFPRELAARCIKAGCPAGGLVLDPFAGTGTTVAEAVLLGRRGVGIELNPEYAKLAEKRIDELCGLLACSGGMTGDAQGTGAAGAPLEVAAQPDGGAR